MILIPKFISFLIFRIPDPCAKHSTPAPSSLLQSDPFWCKQSSIEPSDPVQLTSSISNDSETFPYLHKHTCVNMCITQGTKTDSNNRKWKWKAYLELLVELFAPAYPIVLQKTVASLIPQPSSHTGLPLINAFPELQFPPAMQMFPAQ